MAVGEKMNIFRAVRLQLKINLRNAFIVLAVLLSGGISCLVSPAFAAVSADSGNIMVLTIHANGKDSPISIKLRPDLAPLHVAQIKKLAKEGAYNDVTFHRVIAGFMAQTGDVEYGKRSNYNDAAVGQGKSHYPNIPAEFSKNEAFVRGTVGMARSGDPNSANSQFFICYGDASYLNGQYTIIGTVVKGMETVDALKKGNSAENGKVKGNLDYIVSVRLADSVPQ